MRRGARASWEGRKAMAKKREHFIIDGYNVIHALPELASCAGDLEKRVTACFTCSWNTALTKNTI